jgi:hypothetical protein
MGIIDEKYSNSIRHVGGPIAAGPSREVGAARLGLAKRRGLVHRIVAAIAAALQRQMDRDLARVIARSGGRLTDALEREMMVCQSAQESGFGTEEPATRIKDDRPFAPLGWF